VSLLNVVHADDHLLVLDKPARLLCVPGRGPDKADCLSARAQALCPDALTVHRLDMATSGLVVMGRGAGAQRTLSLAFAERRVHKRYEAMVAGVPDTSGADAEGWSDIHLPLIVDWPNRPKSRVDFEIGKPSHTRWRVLSVAEVPGLGPCARLALQPVTGRSHQLRVHLLALGHPILGDDLYADAASLATAPRLLLHACAIDLPHPVTGERMRFASPPPFSA
jgi:tRNA pseudouridine32 synthase / 23S rRNA pseudouridine746 synthase